MKYMLLLIRSDEEWEALSEAERDYTAIGRWWAEHAQAGHVVGGHQLGGAARHLTVRNLRGELYGRNCTVTRNPRGSAAEPFISAVTSRMSRSLLSIGSPVTMALRPMLEDSSVTEPLNRWSG